MPSGNRVMRVGRGAALVFGLVRVARAVVLVPVLGVGSLVGTVAWMVVPGFAAKVLWRWSSTPGTRLFRARERALLSAARTARRVAL